MQTKPTPADVKEARISAGLTLKEAAEIFGYQLNTWQMKESAGKATRSLSVNITTYCCWLENTLNMFFVKGIRSPQNQPLSDPKRGFSPLFY